MSSSNVMQICTDKIGRSRNTQKTSEHPKDVGTPKRRPEHPKDVSNCVFHARDNFCFFAIEWRWMIIFLMAAVEELKGVKRKI